MRATARKFKVSSFFPFPFAMCCLGMAKRKVDVLFLSKMGLPPPPLSKVRMWKVRAVRK